MKIFSVLVTSTLRSLIRERILYNVFFVAIFLLAVGYLASLLVYGHQDRVMLHFGMTINALSLLFIAAGAGARQIQNETDSRTIYLTLSKPLSRPVYFLSKWVGINLFTAINLSLLTLVLAGGLHLTGGHVNAVFFQALCLTWGEAVLVSALALLVSQWVRPALAMMIVFSYLLISHNHEQINYLNQQGAATFLGSIQFLFPKAEVLLLDTRVYYDLGLSALEFLRRFGYAMLWSLFFILLGNSFFYRKNL